MSYRQDYYKFTHYFFPNTIFNYAKQIIDKILEDKDGAAENLKRTWQFIDVEENQVKNDVPNFNIEVMKISDESTLILVKIPEAKEAFEAIYIGIVFDKEYNVRYFTYEIDCLKEDETYRMYFVGEWTIDWKHLNHGCYKNDDIETFINDIKEICKA